MIVTVIVTQVNVLEKFKTYKKILLLGGSGQVGSEILATDLINNFEIKAPDRNLLNLENDYTFTLHDNHLDESIDEKPFERNSISTACFSDSWVDPEYVGGRFFGAKPSKFKEMFLALEKNVEIDLENDFISTWWDEGHLNWFYNTHKENLSHNLLSVNYHVQEQHDYRDCFTDKKMWYVDKNKRRYKKMFGNRGVFGENFIKFARKINLSLMKYDEQKLKKIGVI